MSLREIREYKARHEEIVTKLLPDVRRVLETGEGWIDHHEAAAKREERDGGRASKIGYHRERAREWQRRLEEAREQEGQLEAEAKELERRAVALTRAA